MSKRLLLIQGQPHFVGMAPLHETLVGLTAGMKPAEVSQWQARMRRLGEKAG